MKHWIECQKTSKSECVFGKLLNKMKPMKKKISKSRVVEESASTIKNYFKTDPNGLANGPNVCVEKEKERKASDSKAVYVKALKDRLKSKTFSVN